MAAAETREELLSCLDSFIDQGLVELWWMQYDAGEIVPGLLVQAGGPLGFDEPQELAGEEDIMMFLYVLFGPEYLIIAGLNIG